MSLNSDIEYDSSEVSDGPLLANKASVLGQGSSGRRATILFCLAFVAAVAIGSYLTKSNGTGTAADGSEIVHIIQKAATHACTNGYVPTHLDISNHISTLHVNVATQEACEAKCDAETGCKAMEYNLHAKHCFTSTSGHDCEADQIPPWVSCVKKGENIQDDGKCKQDVEKEIEDAENNETLQGNNDTNGTNDANGTSSGNNDTNGTVPGNETD